MEIEQGYTQSTQKGIYCADLEGILNALIEIGCIYSEQESICIKVEPTERKGIYIVKPEKCKICASHSECELPPSALRKSNELSKSHVSRGISLLKRVCKYLKKVFLM